MRRDIAGVAFDADFAARLAELWGLLLAQGRCGLGVVARRAQPCAAVDSQS